MGRWLSGPGNGSHQTSDLADRELDIRLFLWDENAEALVAAFGKETGDERATWKSGRGATGAAWKQDKFVVVSGDAVSDETYDLTPTQQKRYSSLASVSALPVRNAADQTLGILTTMTYDPTTDLASEQYVTAQVAIADAVARILVDLLGFFGDD